LASSAIRLYPSPRIQTLQKHDGVFLSNNQATPSRNDAKGTPTAESLLMASYAQMPIAWHSPKRFWHKLSCFYGQTFLEQLLSWMSIFLWICG